PQHRLTITFHGGEPTLFGVKRFRKYAQLLRNNLGDRISGLHVQTNGTLLDDKWFELFRDLDVDVGISLDGEPERHDQQRLDHFGRGSHECVQQAIRAAISNGISPSIIAVVDPAAEGSRTYQHFRSLGIEKIDFLLPDVTHDSKPSLFPNYQPGACAAY